MTLRRLGITVTEICTRPGAKVVTAAEVYSMKKKANDRYLQTLRSWTQTIIRGEIKKTQMVASLPSLKWSLMMRAPFLSSTFLNMTHPTFWSINLIKNKDRGPKETYAELWPQSGGNLPPQTKLSQLTRNQVNHSADFVLGKMILR